MKKVLIIMLLMISMSLFATLNIEIDFATDVVGGSGLETFVSPFFNITNEGATSEFTFEMNVIHNDFDWVMTWCHEDLSDSGLSEGCHHYTQPWNITFPANTVLAVDFQVNGIAGTEGMISFEYYITGDDLTDPIVLPFTFRTANFVSNDNSVEAPVDILLSNYPNPFNPETTISFNLAKSGNVELAIYNIIGQKVTTLVNDYRASGNHNVVWNGKNSNGNSLASGIYLYKITSGKQTQINKMILMKQISSISNQQLAIERKKSIH